MWFKQEIDLFFTTGISFFSMLAYTAINIDNIFMEIMFWIIPQYIVIVFPDQLYSTIMLLLIIIILRRKYILKEDWKKRLSNVKEIMLLKLGNYFYRQKISKDKEIQNAYKNDDLKTTHNTEKDANNNKFYNDLLLEKNQNDNEHEKPIACNKKSDKKNGKLNLNIVHVNYLHIKEKIETNTHALKKQNLDLDYMKLNNQNTKKNYPVVVSYRAYLNLMVIICIFACDFPLFPEKHLKTEYYGLSLMDVGIGAYLFNNGCLHSYKVKRTLKNALLLFVLGCIRLATLHFTGYKINITEYGKHLNFYFTLSFTYLFSLIKLKPKMGLLIMIIYETILRNGLDLFIFTEDRSNLFLQNKEGIYR